MALPKHGDSFPRDALARIRDLEAAVNSLTTASNASRFPITYHDGTHSYTIDASAGALGHQVVDDATELEVAVFDIWSDPVASYFFLQNDTAYVNLFVRGGDPNGVVTAPQGSLLVDPNTPALWQNTDGADTWMVISASVSSFPITHDDGTHTTTIDDASNKLTLEHVRDSDSETGSITIEDNAGSTSVNFAGEGINAVANVDGGQIFLQAGPTASTEFGEVIINGNSSGPVYVEVIANAASAVSDLLVKTTESGTDRHFAQVTLGGSLIFDLRRTTTTPKIGVFGATPVVQPTVTGSRGGNAALASLLTALANLGWIVDSSS